jgi:hypothetical protein
VAHLEPAQWGTDGWPKIGVDLDGNGVGEPVAQPRKPDVDATYPIGVPASTDEFDGETLGLQRLWNHNPDDTKLVPLRAPGVAAVVSDWMAVRSRSGSRGRHR